MKLKRPLRGSEIGADVRMVQRALNKWTRPGVEIPTNGRYDFRTIDRMVGFQLEQNIKPASGNFGQVTLDHLWPFFDAYGRWTYRRYEPLKLVEPDQGWGSLDKTLWAAYSMCRNAGSQFTDLGTYNPASRLPSGAPSDHAVYPAMAFDIGIEPNTGWNNLKARALALRLVKLPAIEYVILGNRIWTDWRKVWGAYYSGGHYNHIHVSGHR